MTSVVTNVEKVPSEEINHNQLTLIVPSIKDAARLKEFQEKVKQIFAARIQEIISSWRETLITLELNGPITIPNMLEKLVTMADVEGAQETQIKNQARQKGILVTLTSRDTDDSG